MDSNENKYRLNQDNVEYILTVGIEGQAFKLCCQESKTPNAPNYTKYYSLENIRQYDGFNSVSSLEDALETFDKILETERIIINKGDGNIKLCAFLSSGGTIEFELVPELDAVAHDNRTSPLKVKQNPTNQVNQSNQLNQMNQAQFQQDIYSPGLFKQGVIQAPTIIHPTQILEPIVKNTISDTSGIPLSQYNQNFGLNDQSLGIGYSQQIMSSGNNYPQTYIDNNYGFNNEFFSQTSNAYNLNQFTSGQYEETYYSQFGINQYTQPNIIDNYNINSIQGSITHTNLNNQPIYQQPIIDGQNMSLQKPSSSTDGKIDAASYIPNSSYNHPNNIPETVKSTPIKQNIPASTPSLNEQKLQTENPGLKNELEKCVNQLNQFKLKIQTLSDEKQKLLAANTTPQSVLQTSAVEKQLNMLKAENDAIKAQLGELPALRRKVAEMEVLRGQLVELNQLRAKLAELNSLKLQIGEIEQLRKQAAENNVLRNQLAELEVLKAQAAESENLRIKVEQLEGIRMEYEQELSKMREMMGQGQRDIQDYGNTSSGEEDKELGYENTVEQIAVKGDIIHNTEEIEMLTKKINKDNQRLTLNLLYKATVDSDKAAAFHEKCDGAQSSLVLVETTNGLRFGGFTTCSWSGDCIDKKDEDAFVFSLDKMVTYDNIPGEDAVGCYPKFGPIFLGCQIRIYDDAFTKGGTTFEKGLNYNTEEDFELNGGERVFGVKEIEVYEVIPQ